MSNRSRAKKIAKERNNRAAKELSEAMSLREIEKAMDELQENGTCKLSPAAMKTLIKYNKTY